MKTLRSLCIIGMLAFFSAGTLASCNTGTQPGDTNVERGNSKDKDSKNRAKKDGEGHRDNLPGADR